jgi:hypothetical protein
MKHLYTIILFLCSYSLSLAQIAIHGSVVDNAEEGIPYATVQLFNKDSISVKNTITDSIGVYHLIGIEANTYFLQISSLGYKMQKIELGEITTNYEVSTIILQDDAIALNEVKVTGNSYIRQKDKVLIIPDKQQVKHSKSGYDLLYNLMIPGLEVNKLNGDVGSVRGTATLYINGRKVEYREVQSLRSKDIEKVEFYEMPTGQYLGDKLSINFVLKEGLTGGYVSAETSEALGYYEGDYNMTGKFTSKSSSFTWWAGDKEICHDGVYTYKTEEFTFPTYTIQRQTDTDNNRLKKRIQYVQLAYDHQKEKCSFNGKLGLVNNTTPYEYLNQRMVYYNMYEGCVDSNNQYDEHSLMPSLTLYGSIRPKNGHQLIVNLNSSFTRNSYERKYSEEKQYSSHTQCKDNYWLIDFNSNYIVQLKQNNSIGINVKHMHQITSTQYEGDYQAWNHLWSGESMILGQYNQQMGRCFIGLQAGVDCTQYRVHDNPHHVWWSSHFNFVINYHISSKQDITLNFNSGNSNPEAYLVSNVDQRIDFLQIKRGNPLIDKNNYYNAYLQHSVQLGKFNLVTYAYYFAGMPCISKDYYIEEDKLVNSYRSDADYQYIIGGINISCKLTNNLQLSTRGNYRYYDITGKVPAHKNCWIGKLNMSYFWKDWSLNLYAESTTRLLEMTPSYIYTPAQYGGSISWNHKEWTIEVGGKNLFSRHLTNREIIFSDVYQAQIYQQSVTYQQNGYIRLAYSFDFGKKTSHNREKVNTKVNSTILK